MSAMSVISIADYEAKRKKSTEAAISEANGSISQLRALLDQRRDLARIYAEDGAGITALFIQRIDVAMIEAALRTAVPA